MVINTVVYAQTAISPNGSSEFCPGENVTFTVTLPTIKNNTVPNVISGYGIPIIVTNTYNLNVSPTQTTFNFVGKFKDANEMQEFKIEYVLPDGSQPTASFQFKKIKSLYYGACNQVQPDIAFWDIPVCDVSNRSITFNNVQWKTEFESPSFCFGSITTYEYLLPSGWILNGTTSTGSNWIPGDNNEIVTPHATTGGYIYIKPTNNCGSGLSNGAVSGVISVLRSGPILRITGGNEVICSGTSYYSITGMPTGATVLWSINNTTDASINNTTSTTVTFTRLTSANTFVDLTATVTLVCGATFTVTKRITLGTLYSTHDIVAHYPSVEGECFTTYSFHYFSAVFTGGFQPTVYQWSFRPTGTTTETTVSGNSSTAGPFVFNGAGDYDIIVRSGNECGITSTTIRTITACDETGELEPRIAISPNPTKSILTVTLSESKKGQKDVNANTEFVRFELYSLSLSKTVKEWKGPRNQKHFKVNIAGLPQGIYFVVSYIEGRKIVKQVLID